MQLLYTHTQVYIHIAHIKMNNFHQRIHGRKLNTNGQERLDNIAAIFLVNAIEKQLNRQKI